MASVVPFSREHYDYHDNSKYLYISINFLAEPLCCYMYNVFIDFQKYVYREEQLPR